MLTCTVRRFSNCAEQSKKTKREIEQRNCFLYDNARPHTARLTQIFLNDFQWDIFPHPSYSPDLMPSDFHAFSTLQLILRENGKPLFRWSRTVCIRSSQCRRHHSMLKASQNSSHNMRNVLNMSKNRVQPNLSSYVNFRNQLYYFLY